MSKVTLSEVLRLLADNYDQEKRMCDGLNIKSSNGGYDADVEFTNLMFNLMGKFQISKAPKRILVGINKVGCVTGVTTYPDLNQTYFTPNPLRPQNKYTSTHVWTGSDRDKEVFAKGWVYLDIGEANRRGKAMGETEPAY